MWNTVWALGILPGPRAELTVLEDKPAKPRPASFFPHQPKTIKVGQLAPTCSQAQTNTGMKMGLAALGYETWVIQRSENYAYTRF